MPDEEGKELIAGLTREIERTLERRPRIRKAPERKLGGRDAHEHATLLEDVAQLPVAFEIGLRQLERAERIDLDRREANDAQGEGELRADRRSRR